MSNSSKTPNLIPITDGDGFETEADSGIIRLFVGSQGDALNWRTGQSRPLKEGEVRPFPLTHPNLIVTAECGLGQRQIARSCSIGLGTVHDYLAPPLAICAFAAHR